MSVTYEPLRLRRPDFPADLIQLMPGKGYLQYEADQAAIRELLRPDYLKAPIEPYRFSPDLDKAFHFHLSSPLVGIQSIALRRITSFAYDHLFPGKRDEDGTKRNSGQERPENPFAATMGPEEFDDHSHLFFFRTPFGHADSAIRATDHAIFTATSREGMLKLSNFAYGAGLRSAPPPPSLLGGVLNPDSLLYFRK